MDEDQQRLGVLSGFGLPAPRRHLSARWRLDRGEIPLDDTAASWVRTAPAEVISLDHYRQLKQRRLRGERALDLAVGILLCSLQVIVLLLNGGLTQPVLALATLSICVLGSLLLVLAPAAPAQHLIKRRLHSVR